jgi:hypothetical protein
MTNSVLTAGFASAYFNRIGVEDYKARNPEAPINKAGDRGIVPFPDDLDGPVSALEPANKPKPIRYEKSLKDTRPIEPSLPGRMLPAEGPRKLF